MRIWERRSIWPGTEGLIGQAERDIMATGIPHTRHPEGTSRIDRAPGAMRALQGHHRERDDRPVRLQPLRAEPVRARPLLAPDGGLSGREHRRRRPRPGAGTGGAFQMSGGAKMAVRVAEVVPVNDLIKRFRFVAAMAAPCRRFPAGAHVVVEMDDHGTRRLNPYSLMSDPEDRSGYEISVRRDDAGRGGSLLHAPARHAGDGDGASAIR